MLELVALIGLLLPLVDPSLRRSECWPPPNGLSYATYHLPRYAYPTLLGTNFPYDKFLPTKTDGDRAYVYCDAAKNQGITASSYGASASGDRNAFCRNC